MIFIPLQSRIASIGKAVDARTEALKALRDVKAKELTVKAEPELVEQALERYRAAYSKVESLRTILPGVRIATPPGGDGLEANELAAQQFLGIEPTVDPRDNDAPTNKKDKKEGLSLPLVILLGVIAMSQIALLCLFMTDPMLSSNDAFNVVVDTVTGME
jgi:hypothetical protein